MFSRFVTLLPVAALAAVAAAAPSPVEARNVCSTGSQYCCNQKFSNLTKFTGVLDGLLGLVADVTSQIGLACDPITVVGLGNGAACTSQTACCSNVQTNGLINIVCSPIAINL